jgi:hypothetical protein
LKTHRVIDPLGEKLREMNGLCTACNCLNALVGHSYNQALLRRRLAALFWANLVRTKNSG